jgi:leucyl aminopeptidase (aminopeptidase T)
MPWLYATLKNKNNNMKRSLKGIAENFLPAQELNPEQKERLERMAVVAKNIIGSFGFDPKKETMTVITDTGVMESQPELIAAIQGELEAMTAGHKARGNFRIRVLTESERSAEDMGDYVEAEMESQRQAPILIITSMSRSHSKETGAAIRSIADREKLDATLSAARSKSQLAGLEDKLSDEQWEKLEQFARQNACRIISITKGKNPHEILTEGAVEESAEAILERDDKVNELMKNVERVHLTSLAGTDLWLPIIKETKGYESEDFTKPGSMGNYPIGEWACSPNWEGSSGSLVINGPIGGEHMLDAVNEHGPVRLTIANGEVTEINNRPISDDTGNPLVESVKAYLNAGNNGHNDAYRLAELGIGTNTMACRGKEAKDVGSSEGEKMYGTVHIAVGSNGSMGVPKSHPSFNRAKVHCDMILMGEVNVECEKDDGSRFFLIKDGKPQGY